MATNASETVNVLEVDRLLAHIDSDLCLLDELVALFRDYYPDQLASIRDSLDRNDGSAVRETAHQLTGAISNFHAPAAVEAALSIEFAGRDGRLDEARESIDRLEQEIARMCDALAKFCDQ